MFSGVIFQPSSYEVLIVTRVFPDRVTWDWYEVQLGPFNITTVKYGVLNNDKVDFVTFSSCDWRKMEMQLWILVTLLNNIIISNVLVSFLTIY